MMKRDEEKRRAGNVSALLFVFLTNGVGYGRIYSALKDARRVPYGGGCVPLPGTQILFAFPRGEVVYMFVTWELLFLLAGLLISLLTYIDIHNKKK